MSDALQRLKNYINNQYEDIKTWDEGSLTESISIKARIDELQCLETYLDYLIARDNGTLDEHYDNMFGESK